LGKKVAIVQSSYVPALAPVLVEFFAG